MLPPAMPPHPILVATYTNGYMKGRQDFVSTTVKALREPAFKDVTFTATEWAEMLQAASEKCDGVKPAKALTN